MDKETVWIKYECRKGNRWITTTGWLAEKPGRCIFSGCNRRHTFWIVGETRDRDVAGAWFRNQNALIARIAK